MVNGEGTNGKVTIKKGKYCLSIIMHSLFQAFQVFIKYKSVFHYLQDLRF